jgi:hypothetical protein
MSLEPLRPLRPFRPLEPIPLPQRLRLICAAQRVERIGRDAGGALAAAKTRGVKLGGPKLAAARQSATASIKAIADRHAANVLPVSREIQRAGATPLHQIADALNARGISTPRGGRWYAN